MCNALHTYAVERNASNKGISQSEAGPKSAAARARVRKPREILFPLTHLNRIHEPLSVASWGVACSAVRGQVVATNSHSGHSSIRFAAGRPSMIMPLSHGAGRSGPARVKCAGSPGSYSGSVTRACARDQSGRTSHGYVAAIQRCST
jgi:hypothetical protein